MSRKNLKSYKNKDDIKNLTNRERAIARLQSIIFHLNNNQVRYGFSYLGYEFNFMKYDFNKKEWVVLESHNFTQMQYNESYNIVRKINKKLAKELGIDEEELDENEY